MHHDLSFLQPRHVERLSYGQLLETIRQYRHAERMLVRNPSAQGERLRRQLGAALDVLEGEASRRTAQEDVVA